MDSKLENKLRKLLALAERGEGGEKDNAQRMLEALLKKHGLTLSDIADDATEVHWFKWKTSLEKRLLFQVLHSVMWGVKCDTWKNKGKRQSIGVTMTKQQMLEVDLLYSSYKRALKDEVDILFSAFVQKNSIFPDADDAPSEDASEQTPEEKERFWRMMNMMNGVQRAPVRKELGASI